MMQWAYFFLSLSLLAAGAYNAIQLTFLTQTKFTHETRVGMRCLCALSTHLLSEVQHDRLDPIAICLTAYPWPIRLNSHDPSSCFLGIIDFERTLCIQLHLCLGNNIDFPIIHVVQRFLLLTLYYLYRLECEWLMSTFILYVYMQFSYFEMFQFLFFSCFVHEIIY